MNNSLYLSQSYQDAWDDYKRSLSLPGFPVWDHIILTASNDHQAKAYMAQIDARRDFLPARTKISVVPDEGGVRVGSGGATLSVLKWINENGGWRGKRILVIHSGGDSRRVPQYSALGKLFSPVPHPLPDGRSSTLFDEFIIAMSAVPGRIREGMLLLSGDVLLIFNALLIDWPGTGAAAISFKEDVATGRHHGVFLRGDDGNVRRFLHKQSEETLRSVGAVNSADCVDIDTGALIFGIDVLDSLWSLVSTDGVLDDEKYGSFVNNTVRLSLYGDFVYPLAEDSSLEAFYKEAPEGSYCEELKDCRKKIWEALRPYRIKLMRLYPSKFIHFGTTHEILHLMSGGVEEYRDLGWSAIVNLVKVGGGDDLPLLAGKPVLVCLGLLAVWLARPLVCRTVRNGICRVKCLLPLQYQLVRRSAKCVVGLVRLLIKPRYGRPILVGHVCKALEHVGRQHFP